VKNVENKIAMLMLQKCDKRIKKLETLEVDWDDDDDSAYLKCDA
jgi:hypothetical protein